MFVYHYPVGLVAAGRLAFSVHIQGIGKKRKILILHHNLCIASVSDLQQMAKNSKTGDISAGMQVKLQGRIHCRSI